ncbi:UNVERIFIED_CONTAM: hypothetical protein GTU68_046343 [Idotea baltica]|nr:hypothetical protein [Idotea baltica]
MGYATAFSSCALLAIRSSWSSTMNACCARPTISSNSGQVLERKVDRCWRRERPNRSLQGEARPPRRCDVHNRHPVTRKRRIACSSRESTAAHCAASLSISPAAASSRSKAHPVRARRRCSSR